jgi:hypothetical protein
MSNFYDEQKPAPDQPYPAYPPYPEPTRSNWVPACLVGCRLMFIVSVLLCAGTAWYAFSHAKRIASDFARQMIVNVVQESDLEAEEKEAIIAQVNRVVEQYQSGKITTEDLGRIMEELAESPLMGAILIKSVEAKYIDPSGLGEEEKVDARVTLQRVLRGLYEEQLDADDLQTAMDYVSYETPDGQRQLKDRVSDDELRAFLQECGLRADEAEVPDEPFEVRISEELKQAIDRALPRGA